MQLERRRSRAALRTHDIDDAAHHDLDHIDVDDDLDDGADHDDPATYDGTSNHGTPHNGASNNIAASVGCRC